MNLTANPTAAPALTLNLKLMESTPVEQMIAQLLDGHKVAAAAGDTYAMALFKSVADLLGKHHELNSYL